MTATPAEPPVKQAQLAAIEQSGWGQPFRLVQLHNLAFWVYAVGIAGGLLGLLNFFGSGARFYAPALTGGVVMFALYLVPWLLLLRHQNRYTSLPAGLLAAAFAWGGVAATFWIALPANTALLELWTKITGPAFAADWSAGFTAPINEEWGKALGLVLLVILAPRLVRSPYDGFIIGAFIGLGFQVFEDVLYVYNGAGQTFGANQLGIALQVFFLRGVTGIASHAFYSAIFCAGLMWVLTSVPGERKVARGVVTMLVAMFFHFTLDDLAGLAGGNGIVSLALEPVLIVVELFVLFYVLRRAAVVERRWTRDLLAPEAQAGTVEPDLLDAVSGLRKDRKAYRASLHDRRAGRHRIEAAHDLAQAIAFSGGRDDENVLHARAELTRLAPSSAG